MEPKWNIWQSRSVPLNQSIKLHIRRAAGKSSVDLINQSINQSINQTIKQSRQWVKRRYHAVRLGEPSQDPKRGRKQGGVVNDGQVHWLLRVPVQFKHTKINDTPIGGEDAVVREIRRIPGQRLEFDRAGRAKRSDQWPPWREPATRSTRIKREHASPSPGSFLLQIQIK